MIITRAFLKDPLIILLDEPAKSMDKEEIENLICILKRFKKKNRTVIIVSQRKEILKGCDRVGRISKGELRNESF